MDSESNSIKSVGTPTSLKTPNSPRKVGFKNRPRLIIPPPQDFRAAPGTAPFTSGIPGTAQFTGIPPGTAPYAGYFPGFPAGVNPAYFKKHSAFLFDQLHGIKDLTKSGLGVGERSAYWLYSKLKKWSRQWFTHMFLTIVLVIYTVGGAFIFEAIEGANEIANNNKTDAAFQIQNVWTSRIQLIQELRALSLKYPNNTSDDEWTKQAQELFEQHKSILIDSEQKKREMEKEQKKKWSFANAIVYCGTVYTSIGYGHIYPETASGKAITIVYALIGVPLFLIALTDFGKLFTRCIKFLWSFVRRLYYTGNCRQARKTAHVEDFFKGAQKMYEIATFRRASIFIDPENPENPPVTQVETPATPAISNFEIDDEFNLPISLAIVILIIYIFLGALIYCIWEGWAFFDSFYFVFISMTTIGFGDMVPDDPACMIVSIVYLVFGLALMSMCINVVQTKLSDTFRQASCKLGATMGITVAEDDGSLTIVPPESIEIAPVHVGQSQDEPTEENEDKSEEK